MVTTWTAYIASKHKEPPQGRADRLAPMAYGYLLIGGSTSVRGYGIGFERSTEGMLAHGIVRVNGEVLIADENAQLVVVLRNPGTRTYLDFANKWLRDAASGIDVSKKDNAATWRELLAGSYLAKLDIRSVSDDKELHALTQAEALALAGSRCALDQFHTMQSLTIQPGLWRTDQDEESLTPTELVEKYAS